MIDMSIVIWIVCLILGGGGGSNTAMKTRAASYKAMAYSIGIY